MNELGISLFRPSGAGSKAYFFESEEAASYGEQLGDNTRAKRILALMACTCASNDNDELTQLVALGGGGSTQKFINVETERAPKNGRYVYNATAFVSSRAMAEWARVVFFPYKKQKYGGRWVLRGLD